MFVYYVDYVCHRVARVKTYCCLSSERSATHKKDGGYGGIGSVGNPNVEGIMVILSHRSRCGYPLYAKQFKLRCAYGYTHSLYLLKRMESRSDFDEDGHALLSVITDTLSGLASGPLIV